MGRIKKVFFRNEPKKPPWRYRKRQSAEKNEPKRTRRGMGNGEVTMAKPRRRAFRYSLLFIRDYPPASRFTRYASHGYGSPIRNPQSEIRNPHDPFASSQWDYAMQEIDID